MPEAERVLETGKEQVERVEVHMVELSRKLDTNEKMICAIMEKSRKHTMQDPQNNTEKKDKSGVRTAGAISFVFLLTLFAKLLGVVREMMQANIFGTGIDADLYTASYNSTLYLFYDDVLRAVHRGGADFDEGICCRPQARRESGQQPVDHHAARLARGGRFVADLCLDAARRHDLGP